VTVERVAAPTPEAAALLAELDAVLGAMYEAHQRHALSLDQVFQPNIRFFVARIGDEAAGCGGVALYGGYAEIKRMYSRPAVRGRGIAKALLAKLEAEARTARQTVLHLETGIHQVEAIGFYESSGFRRCEAFGPYALMRPEQIATSLFYEKPL